MDTLTIGLLITAAVGACAWLLRDRLAAKNSPVVTTAEVHRFRRTEPPASRPELDPQTRFVERQKRQHYRLLNDAEQVLHDRLQEAMPSMRIFAQVGIAQLAQLRSRHDAQRLRQMAGRGVDFVVCGQDFGIVAAIEMVWPTPEGDSAAENEKQAALESLGIPLIVFRPNQLPDAESISRHIADAVLHRQRMEKERA